MPTAPESRTVTSLRRELALACDADGYVTWTDQAAVALLGASIGARVTTYAALGSEQKLETLLRRGREDRVEGFDVDLLVNGRPTSMAFSAEPTNGGVVLVGNLIPDAYGQEVRRLNRELDDSTAGVMALHDEVDEKTDSLRRITEVKSRVVANVSHEFRTPLNAVIGLSKLLLAGTDGELNDEQKKQVGFILRSSESLIEMVNDLLDLSKIEAGKVGLRPEKFKVPALFAALRGMFKPLQNGDSVELTFDGTDVGELDTDQGKVSQILKNLISNALKFTEQGLVRVSAATNNGHVIFTVSDTGIGIPADDQERVFEEFTQIDNPLQRKTKGTGLGLSLSRRLAELLGGTLTLSSVPGAGSTFALTVPRIHPEIEEMASLTKRSARLEPGKPPILVVEDDRQTLFLYEKYLKKSGFQIVPARTVEEARAALARVRPAAIVLDIMLEGEASWTLLSDMKANAETRDIPVLVVTVTNREQKARALGADEFVIKPLDHEWLTRKLATLARRGGPISRILVIDDDEVSRYMLTKLIPDTHFEVIEAATGAEGVRLARERQPQVIFLDFVLPGMTAFDVLDELKLDATTRNIPVIIHTSQNLAEEERRRLVHETAAILPKQSLNREVALGRIREVLAKSGVVGAEEPEATNA